MTAAMVVIMMGRNRIWHASWIALRGEFIFRTLNFQSIVDHHDAILLHDADQEKESDHTVKRKGLLKNEEGKNPAEASKGKR